ncbi:MAG: VOC family protein [Acidobacteriota bacterium]
MRANRSIPAYTVLPELPYPDVATAVTWLCKVFGFSERLRIANHRVQLIVGDGAVIVVEGEVPVNGSNRCSCAVLVRVDSVDQHFERAVQFGATIIRPPTTYPFGERQYTVQDLGGHVWTFSETVADIHPQEWGGELLVGM